LIPSPLGENTFEMLGTILGGDNKKMKPPNDAIPPGVVKLTAPVAPVPTIATIDVEETTVNDETGIPPNVRTDVLLKFVPFMLMIAPAAALVGEKDVIVGSGTKLNPSSDAVPPGVYKLTAPVVPVATIATIEVEETTVNDVTGVPPNVSTDVLLKFVPVMLINAPEPAMVGANDMIVGKGIKVKPTSDAVPPRVVRLTAPVAPIPTIATIDVEETTVNDVTGVPPNVRTDVLLKFVPVILIIAPAAALVGAKDVMVGAGMNANPASAAVPPGVVRLTTPVAPVPIIATIDEEETTVNDVTGVPPNVSTEVPVKFAPVILMIDPTPPLVGAKDVMVGGGMKVNPASEAVPPGVVRLTTPVAPVPIIATIDVEETTVNDVTGVPPNVITEVPVKFVPVMLMIDPSPALVGAKDVMVGAGIKVNPASEAVPSGVVRLTAPVEPFPTIAIIDVEETTVKELTGVPPSVIIEVPVKFVPVMLIGAPAAAVIGAKLVIVGAGGKYVYTQTAPFSSLSECPPTMIVFPSAVIETAWPCWVVPAAPVPTNLLPCCVHFPSLRV
jgi:hypothetical protein